MDYVKRHQQTLQITEPLKVYHIQSIVTRSNQLILATSYGPMILSFSFLAVSVLLIISFLKIWVIDVIETVE